MTTLNKEIGGKMEIGRICVKIAGRDAGKKGVIVDVLEKNFVLIDGGTRRRKCNILHLEPLDQTIKLKKGATHADVVKEFKKLGLDVWEKKSKKAAKKPEKQRKVAVKVVEEKVKKEIKEEPKVEKKEVKPKKSTKTAVKKK